jgi:hypothetical protein
MCGAQSGTSSPVTWVTAMGWLPALPVPRWLFQLCLSLGPGARHLLWEAPVIALVGPCPSPVVAAWESVTGGKGSSFPFLEKGAQRPLCGIVLCVEWVFRLAPSIRGLTMHARELCSEGMDRLQPCRGGWGWGESLICPSTACEATWGFISWVIWGLATLGVLQGQGREGSQAWPSCPTDAGQEPPSWLRARTSQGLPFFPSP